MQYESISIYISNIKEAPIAKAGEKSSVFFLRRTVKKCIQGFNYSWDMGSGNSVL